MAENSIPRIAPSDILWPAVRSARIIRLVGKPIQLNAPFGGHIIYQPALIDSNQPVESSLTNLDPTAAEGSQQMEALVRLASSIYGHIGVVDSKGRVLTTVPVSLGVVITGIRYWKKPRCSHLEVTHGVQ